MQIELQSHYLGVVREMNFLILPSESLFYLFYSFSLNNIFFLLIVYLFINLSFLYL